MVFDTSEVDRRIRKIALEVFPEFDPERWYSHFNLNGEFLVLGSLAGSFYGGHYSFIINRNNGISYNGDIEVCLTKRGKGYGRRLVEVREKISLSFGAHLVIVNNNKNHFFWEKMGYHPLPTSVENLAKKFFVCYMPAYKLLSEA